jgi:TolA-binding protein
VLEDVVKRYPNSTEARLAKSRLERIGNELR